MEDEAGVRVRAAVQERERLALLVTVSVSVRILAWYCCAAVQLLVAWQCPCHGYSQVQFTVQNANLQS